MLKFRVTNSMKARRAAEAQRKALEDKLQLEWAWKPMAAMMNERQTDLVYWIPPLYRNNIKTAGSRVRRKSLAKRSSLTNRLPYTQLQAAHLNASQRKKKLAQRRHKLAAENSFENPSEPESSGVSSRNYARRRSKIGQQVSFEDPSDLESVAYSTRRYSRRRGKLAQEVSFEDPTDADSAVLDSKSEWQDTKDEDNESGIHDETTDYNADDMSLMNVQSIQEEEVADFKPLKRGLAEHRRINRSSVKPKVPPKPDFITRSFEAIDKPKPAPTLLRLLEKVTHIRSSPVKPIKPTKPLLKKIGRRESESSSKKIKRPSVKIYRNPSTRLSSRRNKAALDEQNAMENQCVIVTIDHKSKESPKKAPKSPKSPKAPKAPKPAKAPKAPKPPKPPKTPKAPKPPKSPKASLKATPKATPKSTLKGPPKVDEDLLKEVIKEGPTKTDEAEFRNAQLQMILRLLAQLYEEKVSRQDSEIQNLKMRVQTQDKLMKQMAHVVLELKEDVSKIKIQRVTVPVHSEPQADIPSNVLNIKVGEITVGDN